MKILCWALSSLVLLAACGNSPLFLDIQKEVTRAAETWPKPSIVPPGGSYRAGGPINLSTATPGAQVIYNLGGGGLVYNSHGEVQGPTQRTWGPTGSYDASLVGIGRYPLRAVTWKDGKASEEAQVDFVIAGNGGTAWAKTPPGEGLAAAVGTDGAAYTGGRTTPDSVGLSAGYVTKWNLDGSQAWTVKIQGNSASAAARVTGLAAVPAGGVYVVGTLEAPSIYTVESGPITMNTTTTPLRATPYPGSAGFMTLISSTGQAQGAVFVDSPALNSEFNAVAMDTAASMLYVAATLHDPNGPGNSSPFVRVDNLGNPSAPDTGPNTAGSAQNGFLLKFNASGLIQGWVGNTTSGAQDSFNAVAVDPGLGRVVVGGWFNNEVDYGTGTIASGALLGHRVPLVLNCNLSPALVWSSIATVAAANYSLHTTAQLYGEVHALALSSSGDVMAGGVIAPSSIPWTWSGPGPAPMEGAHAGGSGFLTTLNSAGTQLVSLVVWGLQPSAVRGITVDSSTFFYATGHFGSGAFFLRDGASLANRGDLAGSASRNPFVVKLDKNMAGPYWLRQSEAGSGAGSTAAIAHSLMNFPDTNENRILLTGRQDTAAALKLGAWGSSGGNSGALTLEMFD